MPALEEGKHFLKNFFITGCIAGIVKTIFAPVDRIKLILQSQDNNILILKGKRKRYKGVVDLLIRVPREQGIASFWRGNFTNVIRYIPVQAFNFAYYDFYKAILKHEIIFPKNELVKTVDLFLAGALAAITSFSLTYPLEFCQTRLAVDVGGSCRSKFNPIGYMGLKRRGATVHREFTSLPHCVLKISAISGMKGLYKGFPVALVGATIYRSTYFALFDCCKKVYARNVLKEPVDAIPSAGKMPTAIMFLTAHFVTSVAGFIAYPLDTVGRRLMMESGRRIEDRKYKSAVHCFKSMFKQEGILTFYRGGLTNVVRSYSGALVLVIYEEVKHRTDWISKKD